MAIDPGESIEITPNPVIVGSAPVKVMFETGLPAPDMLGLLTDPNGNLHRLSFTPQPPPCVWRAVHVFEPGGHFGVWQVELSTGSATIVEEFFVEKEGSKPRTRFPRFDVKPREAAPGDPLSVNGVLEISDADGWRPFPGRVVRIAYRPLTGCSWRHVAKALTRGDGSFATVAEARETGQWRAEIDSTNDYSGSASDAVDVLGLIRTRIFGYHVEPVDDDLIHEGFLQKKDGGDGIPGRTIKLKRGGTTKNTVTGAGGRFSTTTAKKNGTWRARFGGSGSYTKSQAFDDYP